MTGKDELKASGICMSVNTTTTTLRFGIGLLFSPFLFSSFAVFPLILMLAYPLFLMHVTADWDGGDGEGSVGVR